MTFTSTIITVFRVMFPIITVMMMALLMPVTVFAIILDDVNGIEWKTRRRFDSSHST